ncbi:TPA: antibiotic biosynthesis monooxygenase [Vibrio parahaemolyticus]|uniref:putative quinol monooxygenase n=1 Tax=Vibrio parahaemolyticus TaxID=670 RepID=UPI001122259B|nr:antibiotic biosynthesis monooxygenase [Vibrio parahaemolyticus]MBE4318682.1 antibiotic biosynthesis monooxygenase [Vibrio parahaemolyticus]MCG6508288.1 antibiotic biosynthesis monooxygenase [Vibrio parahaemolyticus]TOI33479.1 antibiotic biosynthesis monooxygenase [Vibrio parahaemolyticus]HCE2112588.1 antibiotic biosynthesis monooxygenase [Vibrio parahaemolyticus]HCG6306274.1 antibiotic biosynthesis monooxygenase [Vibrio parahaemolyticus]
MSKVTLKGFILVPESELEVVKSELVTHKRLTLEEPGCITFSVTENSNNPLRFDVYEEFKDKSAFEHHQKRVNASHWGKVTVNVECHYEILE